MNGKGWPEIHASSQSSTDRIESRGAVGLAFICAQARGEAATIDSDGGQPRHLFGPVTSTSMPSRLTSTPPQAETESTSSNAPCSRTTAASSGSGLSVPDGVS